MFGVEGVGKGGSYHVTNPSRDFRRDFPEDLQRKRRPKCQHLQTLQWWHET
jgi:hypothetical protein